MVGREVGAGSMGNGTELALGAKVAVGVSVCDLLVLRQGSQRLVGLRDGCQEIQRLLAGAEFELLFGVRLDLNLVMLCFASGAIDVGGCRGRVEH